VLSQMIALSTEYSSMGPAYVQWLYRLQGGS
jgi:hypothetical protein